MFRSKAVIALVAIIIILVFALGALVLGWGLGIGRPGEQKASVARGAEFTMLGADPPTLDPALAGDVESATYIVEIFSGLVTLNKKLEITADIAERWDMSADGKIYTFHLRRGVKFHDGKEVKAGDFKYSIERTCDPRTESTVADAYLGDIMGAKEMLRGEKKEVSGVRVIDDYTLEITIDAPKAYFLAKLTYPTAFVVDKANVESSRTWTRKPNGSGPFKLNLWKEGERLVLERNEQFYREPAKLGRVNFLLAGGSAMTMYENGEVDITGVSLTDIERVLDPTNPLNKELVIASDFSIGYIGFNTTMPPFDDVKVRQAFNHAVDKKKIISAVLMNLVEPANGILPPGMPGYNSNLKGLGYDPSKAKALIAESKYKDVSRFPSLVISIPGTGAAIPPSSEAIIEMWKTNLGVKVEIQQVEWATYLQDLKKHKFQMFEIAWMADYPDPQDFLDILFHSQSLENNPAYSNSEVDKLLEKARVERDVATRLKLYQEAEQIIVNDAPWLPLWYGKGYVLIKSYVKGYSPPPMVIPLLKDVWIEGK